VILRVYELKKVRFKHSVLGLVIHIYDIQLITNSVQQNPSCEAHSCSANQAIPHLYEPKISWPNSQEAVTSSYPEPNESAPNLLFYLLQIRFNITFHLRLVLPSCFFPSRFQTKICMISYLSHACNMSFSSNLITHLKLFIMLFSLPFHYFQPLRSKHFPKNVVLCGLNWFGSEKCSVAGSCEHDMNSVFPQKTGTSWLTERLLASSIELALQAYCKAFSTCEHCIHFFTVSILWTALYTLNHEAVHLIAEAYRKWLAMCLHLSLTWVCQVLELHNVRYIANSRFLRCARLDVTRSATSL
jgi:hypothetical protein